MKSMSLFAFLFNTGECGGGYFPGIPLRQLPAHRLLRIEIQFGKRIGGYRKLSADALYMTSINLTGKPIRMMRPKKVVMPEIFV